MVVRRVRVRAAGEVRVGMFMASTAVGVWVTAINPLMRLVVLVLMDVRMTVRMRMRMPVHDIAMAVLVLMQMFVRMVVLVAVGIDRRVPGGHGRSGAVET